MRIGVIPEGFKDWLTLHNRRFPRPAFDVMGTMMVSRTIMAGVYFRIFDRLRMTSKTAEELAAESGCDFHGMKLLLDALVACDYVEEIQGRYQNRPLAAQWLTSESDETLVNFVRFNYDQWNWVSHLEHYIEHGEARDIHEKLDADAWRHYMLGLGDLARLSAREVVIKLRLNSSPRSLLDAGGGHCQYAVAMCRAYPSLRVTVVDLEPALRVGREVVAHAGLTDRFAFSPGNLRDASLGENYDVAFLFSVLHHLDEASNRSLLEGMHRALRPGGVLAILEAFREESTPVRGDQFGRLLGLFFGVTSRRETYGYEQVAGWVGRAGLRPERRVELRTAPFATLLVSRKP